MNEPTNDFREVCDLLRSDIDATAVRVKGIKRHSIFKKGPIIAVLQQAEEATAAEAIEQLGEMQANITLAYRHLEDARMRLGNVLQAYDGGVSKYDAPTANRQPTTHNSH